MTTPIIIDPGDGSSQPIVIVPEIGTAPTVTNVGENDTLIVIDPGTPGDAPTVPGVSVVHDVIDITGLDVIVEATDHDVASLLDDRSSESFEAAKEIAQEFGGTSDRDVFSAQFLIATASATWTLTHNLGLPTPHVVTYDNNGDRVYGDEEIIDTATVVVTWAAPMTGTARVTA